MLLVFFVTNIGFDIYRISKSQRKLAVLMLIKSGRHSESVTAGMTRKDHRLATLSLRRK